MSKRTAAFAFTLAYALILAPASYAYNPHLSSLEIFKAFHSEKSQAAVFQNFQTFDGIQTIKQEGGALIVTSENGCVVRMMFKAIERPMVDEDGNMYFYESTPMEFDRAEAVSPEKCRSQSKN